MAKQYDITFYNIFLLSYKKFHLMGYSRKKTNRGVKDMEFPEVLKKKHVKFPWVN